MGTDDSGHTYYNDNNGDNNNAHAKSGKVNKEDRDAWNARLSQRRQERRQARLRKVGGGTAGELGSTTQAVSSAGIRNSSMSSITMTTTTTGSVNNGGSGVHSPPPPLGSNERSQSTSSVPSKLHPRLRKQKRRPRSRSTKAAWIVRIGICTVFFLIIVWIVGTAYITIGTSHLTTTNGHGRSGMFGMPNLSNGIGSGGLRHNVVAGGPSGAKYSGEVIDMRELAQTMKFDNPDGGVWKQGWDVDPVPLDPKNPLQIYVVPHSHCDPGWIQTFDEYFQSQTKEILTTVITSLGQDKRRKFIWAEISYFEWWWREQDANTQHLVKRLLHDKQFEFVTGGWVQPDEANTQLYAMEIQLQEGHDFIRREFGEQYIPKYSWSIDPFGYSPTMAYLLKKYDFDAMLIQRVHYAVKKELALHQQLEFYWRQTWDDEKGAHDIFTHVMPFYSYDVPHTCGPDPSICCQFDFARLRDVRNRRTGSCPWKKDPKVITDSNVAERAMLLLDQYRKKANLYRSQNVVLIPLGDDFRWQQQREADAQYGNYQKIFDYLNQNVPGVQIQWGTLSDYFNAVLTKNPPVQVPILKGSFFTYADRDEDYWSGYFTSRIFDKALDRVLERLLYAASSLGVSRYDLQEPRRALSLFQHHDGVTGTAKNHVVEDYANRIFLAIQVTQEWIRRQLQSKLAVQSDSSEKATLQACWQSDTPRGLSQNRCPTGSEVVVYNPLQTEQSCGAIVVPGLTMVQAKLPCEVPGPVTPQSSNDPNRFQFDPNTGLMTHPIQEEWMIWKVQSGGAYLFFPGKLKHYGSDANIEEGGYVVTTKFWNRTIVERKVVSSDGAPSTATALDFIYETNLQVSNEEWFVRFTGDVVNDGVFHTDLNGYNFDTHKFRNDMPIQSQVFPMPTLASIEDAHQRMTILSEHAQGTASLEDGSIDVWLDRRLKQDDNRGLGQGVKDNVPTRTRLRVVLEREGYYRPDNYPEFEITPLCKRLWKELNHPLELYGQPNGVATRESHKIVAAADTYFVPLVYMVYNRVDYLQRSIDTLRNSDFPRDTVPIVISHDGHMDEMVAYVQSLRSEFRVIQIFHPYSCSEHPHSFPGDDPKLNEDYKGDFYGNPRDGKVTCCKHHFTWMINQVFDADRIDSEYPKDVELLKGADSFLFLEEDYIVAPTIYSTIQTGMKLLHSAVDENDYFGIVLDPSNGFSMTILNLPPNAWLKRHFVSGPMVLSRHMFQKIKENSRLYCTFDDYNWDWSIVHLMTKNLLPSRVLCTSELQVAHIGLSGMHGEGNGLKFKVAERIRNTGQLDTFSGTEIVQTRTGKLRAHHKGYGGWGHPADHDHCLQLFNGDTETNSGFARSVKGLFGFGR